MKITIQVFDDVQTRCIICIKMQNLHKDAEFAKRCRICIKMQNLHKAALSMLTVTCVIWDGMMGGRVFTTGPPELCCHLLFPY